MIAPNQRYLLADRRLTVVLTTFQSIYYQWDDIEPVYAIPRETFAEFVTEGTLTRTTDGTISHHPQWTGGPSHAAYR